MAHKRWTTEKVKAWLAAKSIEMTGEYTDSKVRMPCKCTVCGYAWLAYWGNVKRGDGGCRMCSAKKTAVTLLAPESEVRQKLADKRIELVSPYAGTKCRHRLKCLSCQHTWSPVLCDVLRRTGCPNCWRTIGIKVKQARKTVVSQAGVKMREAATRANISISMIGTDGTVFEACCSVCKHCWKMRYCSAKHVKCPSCRQASKKCIKRGDAEYSALAEQYGGECVVRGENTGQYSIWKCPQGHVFKRAYSTIVRAVSFCPRCSDCLSERICRATLEAMFNASFDKVKIPARSARGCKLELDGYNSELKIAFEHNGAQHYAPDCIKGQSHESAVAQYATIQVNDALRAKWCKENGVRLIVIRQLGKKVTHDNLVQRITEECARLGVAVPNANVDVHALLKALPTNDQIYFGKLKSAVHRKGWALLTEAYLGSQAKYRLKCEYGHDFSLLYTQIHRDTGCPQCWKAFKNKPVERSDKVCFGSAYAAAKEMGVSITAVRSALRRNGTCQGFTFKYCV